MLNINNNFKALSTESEVLNSNKLHTCSNEKGRSMIEMLGVLAIIGVLSVGGIAGYSKAMMKFKINKTLDQVAMLVTNIRTMYAQQNNYTGLNAGTAISLNLADDAMKLSTSKLTSPFGEVTIDTEGAAIINDTEDNTAFTITLTNLPKDACVAIATNSWGSAYSAGFLGMAVGGGSTSGCTTRGTGDAADGVVCSHGNTNTGSLMSVADAVDACDTAGTITLKYY